VDRTYDRDRAPAIRDADIVASFTGRTATVTLDGVPGGRVEAAAILLTKPGLLPRYLTACVAHPLPEGTRHRLLGTLVLLTSTIILAVGDQEALPTCRVMYSFSMDRLCWFCSTCAFGLLAICLGSVMAFGNGKAWAEANELISTTITNEMTLRMRVLGSAGFLPTAEGKMPSGQPARCRGATWKKKFSRAQCLMQRRTIHGE